MKPTSIQEMAGHDNDDVCSIKNNNDNNELNSLLLF